MCRGKIQTLENLTGSVIFHPSWREAPSGLRRWRLQVGRVESNCHPHAPCCFGVCACRRYFKFLFSLRSKTYHKRIYPGFLTTTFPRCLSKCNCARLKVLFLPLLCPTCLLCHSDHLLASSLCWHTVILNCTWTYFSHKSIPWHRSHKPLHNIPNLYTLSGLCG